MIPSRPGYMQTRSLEAGLALLMVVVGIQLARTGDTFAAPIYAVMRAWVPEDTGGMFLAATGILRFAALIVNGHIRETPIARGLGCLVGLTFWSSFAYALESGADQANVVNPILGLVSAAFAALETYSMLRTGMDASTLDSLRLQQRRRRAPRA